VYIIDGLTELGDGLTKASEICNKLARRRSGEKWKRKVAEVLILAKCCALPSKLPVADLVKFGLNMHVSRRVSLCR
jgi:hypothetical protein